MKHGDTLATGNVVFLTFFNSLLIIFKFNNCFTDNFPLQYLNATSVQPRAFWLHSHHLKHPRTARHWSSTRGIFSLEHFLKRDGFLQWLQRLHADFSCISHTCTLLNQSIFLQIIHGSFRVGTVYLAGVLTGTLATSLTDPMVSVGMSVSVHIFRLRTFDIFLLVQSCVWIKK